MSKHTSGPWKREETKYRISFSHQITVANNSKPAVCAVHQLRRDPAQSDANACLIAAAPDLLEACKAMSEHIGKECGTCQAMLDTAIAKATTPENTT